VIGRRSLVTVITGGGRLMVTVAGFRRGGVGGCGHGSGIGPELMVMVMVVMVLQVHVVGHRQRVSHHITWLLERQQRLVLVVRWR